MGCRKYKGEAFFDDLTGETQLPEELERLVFVFDGQAYEIDLTDGNAAEFRGVMERYTSAARTTSKSKVLSTLPKRRRHLRAVPDVPPSPVEESPQGDDFDQMLERSSLGSPVAKAIAGKGLFPQEGEESEPRLETEGTQVPESPSNVSDSGPGSQIQNGNLALRSKSQGVDSSSPESAPKPTLTVVPRPTVEPIPEQWTPYKPERRDDMADRRLKARQWAGAMGMQLPDGKVTDEILKRWEGFYRERRWTLM